MIFSLFCQIFATKIAKTFCQVFFSQIMHWQHKKHLILQLSAQISDLDIFLE